MVFFTCNACGTSLKKGQVEKHRFQCRNPSTTYCCVDCLKDFTGEDYKDHTKCITEEQKYSGVGWKPPAGFQKGEKKQQAWVETVQNVLSDPKSKLDPMSRKLLQCISKHDNIPRKKPKFMNFIRNITKNCFDNGTVDRVWVLLEAQWKPAPKPEEPKLQEEVKKVEENKTEEDSSDIKRKSKKKKKKVKDEDGGEEQQIEVENTAVADENLAEEESDDKKRKSKKKKRKIREEDADKEEQVETENTVAEENGVEENAASERKSKKKKRKLRDEEEQKVEVDNIFAEENMAEDDNTKKKNKSKKKKLH